MAGSVVRVHDLTPQGSAEARLSVVSGLRPAAAAISDGYAPFLPGAVAPGGEWRRPACNEISSLVSDPGVYSDSDVLVVPVPELTRVLADALQPRDDFAFLQKAVHEVNFLTALEGCVDDLLPFCIRADGLVCQGTWVSPGGMRLVTQNIQVKPWQRIGLHVDNWDDLPFLERAGGRRRLCVNLGLGPRYLVFLTTPLSVLVASGLLPRQAPGGVSPATMIRAYLGRNLRQLVVRVRVDPGEAYIMNADDIIHDGATDASGVPDVALHFLGHFGA